MRLMSLDYSSYSKARISVQHDDATIFFDITEDQKKEIEALALRFFSERQSALVKAMQAGIPQLADFTEVSDDA